MLFFFIACLILIGNCFSVYSTNCPLWFGKWSFSLLGGEGVLFTSGNVNSSLWSERIIPWFRQKRAQMRSSSIAAILTNWACFGWFGCAIEGHHSSFPFWFKRQKDTPSPFITDSNSNRCQFNRFCLIPGIECYELNVMDKLCHVYWKKTAMIIELQHIKSDIKLKL